MPGIYERLPNGDLRLVDVNHSPRSYMAYQNTPSYGSSQARQYQTVTTPRCPDCATPMQSVPCPDQRYSNQSNQCKPGDSCYTAARW